MKKIKVAFDKLNRFVMPIIAFGFFFSTQEMPAIAWTFYAVAMSIIVGYILTRSI